MNKHLVYRLLKIIKHNGNIWELVNAGYEFGQLTHFIDTLKADDYISTDDDARIVVSPTGDAFINGFETNNNIKQYSKWILPRVEMWQKPISKFDVYIPKE